MMGRRFWVHQGEGSSSWATGIKANTSKSSASLLKKTELKRCILCSSLCSNPGLPSLITNRQQIKRQPLEYCHPLSGSVSLLRYPFTVEFTVVFSFCHCKMLHILQWANCKFTLLPDIIIVNLQCTMSLHCKFTVGTSREIDLKAMAFTVAIQWLYSGYTVYLQCAHCKIIQWRELLSSLPL